MPEKEWPTRTVGPSWRASTRSAEATASGSVVNGFCTEVALRPAACNRAITSVQHDPSANSPCTSTTLRAFVGVAFAAMPRVETSEAAAPASRAVEKVRRLIMMSTPSFEVSLEVRFDGAHRYVVSSRAVLQLRIRKQHIHIMRTHDGIAADEVLMVVLDAVMVIEIIDHDTEGLRDRTWRSVAEPVDPLEPRAVAEMKTRYRIDAASGHGWPRQIARAKPHQFGAQLCAPRRVM